MTNLWKRSISLFLTLVMVIGMLPVSAFANETEPETPETISVTEPAVAETTEAPTEAPTEPEPTVAETTEAPTEPLAEETTLPPETEGATTEPSEETKPVVRKETFVVTESAAAAAVTEPEETVAEETEPEETIPEETKVLATRRSYRVIPDGEQPSENELLSGYLDQQFFGKEASAWGTAAGNRLTGDTKLMYGALVGVIEDIAAGDRESTVVTLGYDDILVGIYDDNDVLIGTEIYNSEINIDFAETGWTEEHLDAQLDLLLDALLADLPYELYWFDKVTGIDISYIPDDMLLWIKFSFPVADNYQGADDYSVDTGLTGAAVTTAANAKTVVSDVKADVAAMDPADPDYETLLAYKNWICDAVDYNSSAASSGNFSTNSDPWQLIHVFDGDDTTNVVCEGYSKAFQYLCDLTPRFKDDAGNAKIVCYSVDGDMVNVGAHMWNIVDIQGSHYLADITNSDTGKIGDDGSLFLVGGTPDSNGVYRFSTQGSTTSFAYSEDTQALWENDGILTLAASSYTPVVNQNPDTMTQAEFEAAVLDSASNGSIFYLTKEVTLATSMTIPGGAQVYIQEGGRLNVPSGVELTNAGYIQIDDGKCIIEGGITSTGSIRINSGIMYFGYNATWDICDMRGPIVRAKYGDTDTKLVLYEFNDTSDGIITNWNSYYRSTIVTVPGITMRGLPCIQEWDAVNYEWKNTPLDPADLTVGNYLTVNQWTNVTFSPEETNADKFAAIRVANDALGQTSSISYNHNGTTCTLDFRFELPPHCAFYSEPQATADYFLGFNYTIDPTKTENSFYFIFTNDEGWHVDETSAEPFSLVKDPFSMTPVTEADVVKISTDIYKITIKPSVIASMVLNGGRFPMQGVFQAADSNGNTTQFSMGQLWCSVGASSNAGGIMSQADFQAAVNASAANGTIFYLDQKVTLTSPMTIPVGAQIYILEGGMLMVPSGVVLTNEGHIQLVGGKCIIEGGITSTGSIRINSGIMYFGYDATWSISDMNGPIIRAKYGDTATKLMLYGMMDPGSGITTNWSSWSTSNSIVPGMFLNGLFCIREWDSANYEWINTPINPYDLSYGDHLTVKALADTPNPGNLNYSDANAYNFIAVIAEEGAWDQDTYVSYTHNGTTYTYNIRLERIQRHGFYSTATASNETWLGFGYNIDPDKAENAFYYIFTDSTGWSIDYSAATPFAIMDNPFDRNPVGEVSWKKINDSTYKITIDPDVAADLCTNGGSFPIHVEVAVTDGSRTDTWGIGTLRCQAQQQGLNYDFHAFYSTPTASDETRLGDTFILDPDAGENAFYYIFTDNTGFSIVDGSFAIMDNPGDRNKVDGVRYEKISDTVYKIIISSEKVAELAENGGYVPVFVEVTATNSKDGYTNTYGWGQIQCKVIQKMTQAEFEAAMATAAAAGEIYFLKDHVTITKDMTINCYVEIEPGASLTVAEGVYLTVTKYNTGDFAQVAINGEMTVKSGATLRIVDGSLLHAYAGNLTVEEGVTILTNWDDQEVVNNADDHIWFNKTLGGTVTGVDDAYLGIEFYPETCADLEAALATTGYSHVHVFMHHDITLDRNIIIPATASVDITNGHTLTVPANFTLTNNSDINIQNENRLEVLKEGTLVNNGTINIEQYGQLYYYEGTLTGNGTISGDGDIVTNKMSHQALIDALADCYANGSGWVHESETTLDPDVNNGMLTISMGDGDPSPQFYLVEGGTIIVPSGTTLQVYNPLIVHEGGKVIVEEGGRLYVNGTLSVEGGTVYIEEGADFDTSGEYSNIHGKVTFAWETDPYLSETWLDNSEQGWYFNTNNNIFESEGIQTMSQHWRIYFLNTWDAANLQWIRTPVMPVEYSEYMAITPITEMENQRIREGEEYAQYFVHVQTTGTLEHQDEQIYVNGTAYDYALYERTVGFYTRPEVSMDSIIASGEHRLDASAEENAIYFLLKNPERYEVDAIDLELDTHGVDFTQFPGGDNLVDMKKVSDGVYKLTIHPDYVQYVMGNWNDFGLKVIAQLDPVDAYEDNHERQEWNVWIQPPELGEPGAVLLINDDQYQIYGDDVVFRRYLSDDCDEWGNRIWKREFSSLPTGVSYVLADNKIILILDNANLTRLELFYYESGTDPEGNFWEHYGLPSENVTISLVGSSTISNTKECAFVISRGANVTFTGNGSLLLKAENSPENVNDEGKRYAYPAVVLEDGGNMTVSGNATVTAEIAGSGFHGDQPAQMEAIAGHDSGTLILGDNAVLNIVTPKGARTLDERQENYGSVRSIVGTNIVISDNATLNADTIYLWSDVDFTMNGGTVNLRPLGEIFYNPKRGGYVLSQLGVYMEHESSFFTMNGGTINMDLSPEIYDEDDFVRTIFQGINAAPGHVIINGGEININSPSNDGGSIDMGAEIDAFGIGVAIECAWNEDGPDASLPASSLTVNGGTVNIYPVDGEDYEALYVAPYATADFSGGAIHVANTGESYLTGIVTWTGDTALTGTTHIRDGATITVAEGGFMTITDETTVHEGNKIVVEDGGSLHVSGHLTVEGTVYIKNGGSFTTDNGEDWHVTGKITREGETDPYLTSTWLDNKDNQGWYMNEEFHRTNGLMAMEEHWRIFFLHTWDAENLVWNSEPVVPTVYSEYMTITPVAETDNPTIREDQDPELSGYFVCVNVFGTLDDQIVYLNANDQSIRFAIYKRTAGFFRTAEFSMDSYIEGHGFTLDPTAKENALYWLVRNPADYRVVSMDVSCHPWGNEDFSQYIPENALLVTPDDSQSAQGIYKFTVHPDFVDYVQYDYKNFELRVDMVLDYKHDKEIREEPVGNGMWINPPELKKPVAALGIDNCEYLIYDTDRIFRDYFTGEYDDRGNEIWKREETSLPTGISYVLNGNQDSQLILDGANLTSLDLAPYGEGYDEEGNYWRVDGLPNENLTITVYGENTITNNANSAIIFNHGLNVTVNGTGTLYVKTTNYVDAGNVYNTINLWEGSTLTIGGDVELIAEVAGQGYWDNGEAATCHAISGGYNGETLEITENATLTTVLPYGARRYDGTGTTSQIGGYVGIQNFNSITVSGGTLNTDHLNFYKGGDFNLTGGVVNIKDIGEMNPSDKDGTAIEYHYEGIRMWDGNINISGGELNMDVSPREGETADNTHFYGINGIFSTINISGGTVNITGGSSDGWAILADCEWNEDGYVEGTGSSISVTGGTINVNAAEHTYHGGILVSEICEGYFGGGEINDDYGIHRFFGNTTWGDGENGGGTVLNGKAAGVYTHGPGEFVMYDGQINLTGDIAEENNRGHIVTGGATTFYGGQINLTNGTLINEMSIAIEGGEITVVNDWAEVPGIENNLYLPVVGGTIDITTNGTSIVNQGTLHQMGGRITAENTETAETPVIHSIGSLLLNDGTMDLTGGYYGILQNYDFEAAAEDDESMLFAGAMDVGQIPTLNISGSKMGIYASAPVLFPWNATVNIDVEGAPGTEGRDWPIAILIDELIDETTGENVSYLSIGGSKLNLTATDTAGSDIDSKGIVAWNSPVYIENFTDEETGTIIAEPDVTIDAEIALFGVSDSPEITNFDGNVTFINAYGEALGFEGSEIPGLEGAYMHILMDGDSYAGWASTGNATSMSLEAFLAAVAEAAANNETYTLTKSVLVDENADLPGDVIIGSEGKIRVKEGYTLTNDKTITVLGALDIYGTLVNNGSIRVEGSEATLTTYEGASLVNNLSVSNRTLGAKITLADGTYSTIASAELVQTYFEGGDMTSVVGAPDGTLSILYEGSNPETILAVSEMFNWSNGHYQNCFLRVIGDVTIPADMELNLTSGTYLVVLNNGSSQKGSLTVEGQIFNQSYIRLFGADMTIPTGGWITNKGSIEAATLVNETPNVTVGGLLENASTGIVDLSKATFTLAEGGIFQNNLAGKNLGTVSGVPVEQQNLFSEITDGTQAQLQTLIAKVMDENYNHGYFWVSSDLTISSSTAIPDKITLAVQDGHTLTIASGATVQLNNCIIVDAGAKLDVYGTLGVGGTVDVRGTMYVDAYGSVGLGNDAQVNVLSGGELTVSGYFGVDGGTLNVEDGGTCSNNGTVSATWTETHQGTISTNLTRKNLYMPMAEGFDHDEADIQAMLAYANANGFTSTQVHFRQDYTFTNSFTVPENMTMMIGAYPAVNATVTVPTGKTLTVDGKLQIATGSKLVLKANAQLDSADGKLDVYGEIIRYCGENATWNLNNGVLTISGSGAILSYAQESAPWAAFADQITSVKIGSGITGIGDNAFRDLAVESILIPRAVATIGSNAFAEGTTLKVYHDSAAETYAENNGYIYSYIHEIDPETGKCVVCDNSLNDTLTNTETTVAEKVEAVKDTDTESLKTKIETEMESSDTGTSDTMDLIEDLEEQVKEDTNISVSTQVEATSTVVKQTFTNVSDEAIVGAVLNADEGVSEVKLVIGDATTTTEDLGETYDPETAVLFSMTLDGVSNTEELDVPVKITLPVPEGIQDLSKLKILHYHGDKVEEVSYTLSTGTDGKAYVTFVLSSFSDFAFVTELDEDPAQYGTLTSYAKSLLFEDIIRVRYYFNYEGDYTQDYLKENGGILIWTSERENYEPGTEDYQVEGFSTYTDKNGTHFHTTAEGIAAKQWGDLQYACAYVKNPDGSYTYSEVSCYSPLTYATNMLNKSSTKESLKTLLVAMLNYGSSAQTNFKYNAANLMNSGLSADQQNWIWDESLLITKLEVDDAKIGFAVDENIGYYAWSLLYEGAIGMRMYNSIAADLVNSAQEMGILYWTEDVYTNAVLTPENTSGKIVGLTHYSSDYYHGTIEGTPAKNLGDTCFACAYVIDEDGNVHYGEVRSYSAHTYARNQINGNKTEALKNLCKTMVIYSDAAAKHFD